MRRSIDELLTRYEAGALTRRGLLAAIALLAAPRPARAKDSLVPGAFADPDGTMVQLSSAGHEYGG